MSPRKGWWTFREAADAGQVATVAGDREGSVDIIGNDVCDVEEEGKGAETFPWVRGRCGKLLGRRVLMPFAF